MRLEGALNGGEDPPLKEIQTLLLDSPPPAHLREYVKERFSGARRRKRGRPRKVGCPPPEDAARILTVLWTTNVRLANNKLARDKKSREHVMYDVAKEVSMSMDSLKPYIKKYTKLMERHFPVIAPPSVEQLVDLFRNMPAEEVKG